METDWILLSSIFLFRTSWICPLSGPCFTFSRPIRYKNLEVRMRSRFTVWNRDRKCVWADTRTELRLTKDLILPLCLWLATKIPHLHLKVYRLYLEPSVKLHHHISKVDPFSAADKAANLWTTVRPDVVAHKVPVKAVFPTFLFVQQDVRC